MSHSDTPVERETDLAGFAGLVPAAAYKERLPRRQPAVVLPPLKLSLSHLFLGSTCIALDLGIRLRWSDALWLELAPPSVLALVVLNSLLCGALWAGSLVAIRRCWKLGGMCEPGGWLLVVLAAAQLYVGVLLEWLRPIDQAALLLWLFGRTLACGMFLAPLFSRNISRIWKGAFSLLLLIHLAAICSLLVEFDWGDHLMAFMAAPYVSMPVVLIASLLTIRTSQSWLHRLGVWLYLLIGVQSYLYEQLFY